MPTQMATVHNSTKVGQLAAFSILRLPLQCTKSTIASSLEPNSPIHHLNGKHCYFTIINGSAVSCSLAHYN